MRSNYLKFLGVVATVGIGAIAGGAFGQTTLTNHEKGIKPILQPGNTLQNQPPPGGFTPDPPGEQGICPPSGYAPPQYSFSGDNADGITEAYEVASPCNSQEVRDVAEALGMARMRPVGLKEILSIGFVATGNFAAPLGMGAGSKVTFHGNYLSDSARIDVSGPAPKGGKASRAIHVVSDGKAWDEATPGAGISDLPDSEAPNRSVLLKLTPFGAMFSIIEAEGHVTQDKVGGKLVLKGTSPYDNWPVTLTVGARNLPEKAEVQANGHTYTATFQNYKDSWEPAYYYVFPAHIVWTMDGKPVADLNVTAYNTNYYSVFPHPGAKSASN